MSTPINTTSVIAAAVAAALLVPAATFAAEVQVAADVGVGTSDNILRTPTNERSETIEQLGLQFFVQNQSRLLSTDLRGDLAFLNYDKNTYSSELVGNAGAAFKLGLIEDKLSWSLDDVFGQTRRDPYAVVTPLNRENVNYFSTGPNLLLQLSSTNHLLANARYGRVSYQTSLYDTDRYSAQAGFEHDLSGVSHLGFNLSHERVDPQNGGSLFKGYNRQEAFGRYRFDSARTKGSLDIGASRVDRSGLSDNGALIRLELTRQAGDFSTFSLKAGRQISDAGLSMAWSGGTALPAAGLDTQSLARTVNPFNSTFADLSWLLTGRRTHIAFGGSVYDENYASTAQLDRKRYTASVRADRQLTPRMTVRAGFAYNKYDYTHIAESNDDTTFDLGLNWTVGRHLSLDFLGQRSTYNSQLLTGRVDETRIWLKLRYASAR